MQIVDNNIATSLQKHEQFALHDIITFTYETVKICILLMLLI